MLKREIKKTINDMKINDVICFSCDYENANSITHIRVTKKHDGYTLYDSGRNFHDQEPTWKNDEKDVLRWVWEEKPYKACTDEGECLSGKDY